MATRATSTVVTYRAWDTSVNAPKTGDVANHTLRWIKDGTSAAPTNSPAEVDATNAKGVYKLTLTTTETNCQFGVLAGVSATANVAIFGVQIGFDAIPAALSAGGYMQADVLAFNADTTAAANIAKTTRAIGRGTVTTGGTTTSIPTSAFTPNGSVADQFKGRIITFDADTTTVALRGQSTDITANTGVAAPTFTVTALTSAPASGDTFSVT